MNKYSHLAKEGRQSLTVLPWRARTLGTRTPRRYSHGSFSSAPCVTYRGSKKLKKNLFAKLGRVQVGTPALSAETLAKRHRLASKTKKGKGARGSLPPLLDIHAHYKPHAAFAIGCSQSIAVQVLVVDFQRQTGSYRCVISSIPLCQTSVI